MNPVFNVRTAQVNGQPPVMSREVVDMFSAALGVPGDVCNLRFETMQSHFDPEVYSPNPASMMMLHRVFPFISDIRNAEAVCKSGSTNGVKWTAVVLNCSDRGNYCFLLEGFKPCNLFAMGLFAPMFITSQMPQDRSSPLTVTHVFSGCCAYCGLIREKFLYCSACKSNSRVAQYCNAACQLGDWKGHKKACFAKK
jgi:hypothetical protein